VTSTLTPEATRRVLSREEQEQIRRLLDAGHTRASVARWFSVPQETVRALHRAWGRGVRADGCHECRFDPGVCDLHQVPPVCVCDEPTPGWMNECGSCRRPYGPLFAEVRQAWRDHLAGRAT
jgi:hypothetical protein